DTVHATSISLFKRFYLTQAVFNHDIKVVLITCIFLAAKIESSYIPLTDFLAKVPQFQRPDVDVIRDYELIVADAVGFDFMVRQVKWPLHGLFLDLQVSTYFSTAYTSHDTRKQALNNLVKMYTRARELMQNALCSDLSLTHQSSQIALGCFVLASKELDATLATNKSDSQPKQQFLRDDLDRYISYRINWVGTDTIAALQQKLSSVEDAIMGQIEFEKMAKDTKSIVSVRAKEVGAKLQGCLNPEYLPNSRVFEKRRREEESAKDTKRQKKIVKENERRASLSTIFD
ncbi:hypothetical protein HK100_012481, partial [Physocladia obscura]